MDYKLMDQVVGLAPTVIENNKLITYSGIFLFNEQGFGLSLADFIHELESKRFINSEGPYVLDGLAANGDILQDFPLTEQGLNFLIKEMGVIQSDNPLLTFPIQTVRGLLRQGYNDLFVCHGEVWGFFKGGVMPVPCPLSDRKEIL